MMSMKLRGIAVFVALTLALVFCGASWGQVLKGSISGTVVDPQGAVVSGATVKATNAGTGAVQTTTSDNSGLFRFNLIPVGTYKVETTVQGFKTQVTSNVLVSAGSDSELGKVQLAIGIASTTLEINATAPLIETNTSQVTSNFGQVELQTFAGIQENQGLDNLALFVPGIVSVRDNSFSNTNGGAGFSSNGLRGRNNDQEIDGQNNNDNSVGGPALFVSDTEFVGQYVIVTNNFGPEYGRNAGSVVNIITKSGTNNWHGSLYGTENNSILNSLPNSQKNAQICGTDCKTKPDRLNNEFAGATIGGPWVKNKVFLFGGFDEQIISTIGQLSTTNLTPTPAGLAQLNGCFPGSTSLQNFNKFGPYSISAGNPHPFKFDPANAQNISDGVTTCVGVPFAGVARNLPQPFHGFNYTMKTDLQLGSNTITARYLFNRGNVFNADFGDGANGYPANVPALSQAILVSWTHQFTGHMVNEARVGFNRLNVDFGGNSIGNTVPTADGLLNAVAQGTIQATGFDNLFGAANNLPQSRIVNTWQVQDNWNYVMGKHQLKAGVNFTYQRSPNTFLPNIDGTFRFASWSRFIRNTPNRVRIADGVPTLDFREYDTFVYGGDDWKIAQNLTLNLGLTWTYYGQPANLFNQITTKRETNAATQFWNPALPLGIRTDPTIPAPKNSFGPSIGFAYSPQWGGFLTGHGKTTFRGGYRFLYDPPFYNIYLNISTATPETFLQTFSGTQPTSRGIPAAGPTGPNVRAELAPFLTKGIFDPRSFGQTNISPNFGPDKVHSYSLGFEREITKNSAIEVRYAGNRAYDLFQTVNGNPKISALAANYPSFTTGLTPCAVTQQVAPYPAGVPTDLGRVNCGLGATRTRNNGGYSRYNGLQTEFRANNLFKQLTIRTGYTFSKNLDNVSEIFATFAGGNSQTIAQNPLNTTKGEYSFSGLDTPHQWTILFTEQLPFFKEQHGLLGHVLGGWAFSGNYVLASGQRYTPIQAFVATASSADYYDVAFWGAFIGAEPARPFLGNPSAPATAVGIFAADACAAFFAAGPGCLGVPGSQLVSMNSLNSLTSPVLNVTKNDVRYIMNGGEAQLLFGTPFGNTPRNIATDDITNIASFSIFKRFKLSERASFEFRTTLQNAFNHPNFQSVDPILEDASDATTPFGFGNPKLSNTTPFFYQSNNTRIIYFGGTLRF
jgi:hypothetical protein